MRARAVPVLSALVPLLAALWMWRPILGTAFYADDFIHLFDLVTLAPSAFLTQIWGGHLYLVRNAIFLGMFDAFGADPRPFYWSMLLTHLLNVLLLQRLLRRLTGDVLLAGAAAVLWGTCPTLEGVLGWYSVWGQALLTTLVLIVLERLAATISTRGTLSVRTALVWGTILAAGGACFGIGLGLAAAFPVAVMIALPPRQRSARAIGMLGAAAIAILAIYTVVRILAAPHLDPGVRVMLSPGALLAELPAAVVLAAQMIGVGAYALPFGFLDLAVGHPTMAIGGGLAVALAVGGWVAADPTTRRCLLALGVLTLAAYGTIAFGRTTALEYLNLSTAHAAAWPRYHYLALALLTATGCTALAAMRDAPRDAVSAVDGIALTWAALRLVVLLVRPPALDLHEAARVESATSLAAIRAAIAAAPAGGVAVIDNRPFGAAAVPWLFPGWAGLFVIHFPDDVVDGRTVRFRADDVHWRLAQSRGGRIARLVEAR